MYRTAGIDRIKLFTLSTYLPHQSLYTIQTTLDFLADAFLALYRDVNLKPRRPARLGLSTIAQLLT